MSEINDYLNKPVNGQGLQDFATALSKKIPTKKEAITVYSEKSLVDTTLVTGSVVFITTESKFYKVTNNNGVFSFELYSFNNGGGSSITNVSELINDAGYLVESDIAGLASTEWVEQQRYLTSEEEFNASTAKTITRADIEAWNAKSNFSGSYNDLEDKPEIPDTTTFAKSTEVISALAEAKGYTNDAISSLVASAPETMDTLKELSDAIGNNKDILDTLNTAITEKADKSEIPDVSNFATKDEIPTISLDGYATEDFVAQKIAEAELGGEGGEGPDLSGYVTKSEIEGFITSDDLPEIPTTISSFTNDAGYLTEHQDISGLQPKLSDDIIEYLNSKLSYTYGYSCSISASPSSITFPSNTTKVTYTATFSVSKRNDISGSKAVSISSISNVTSGWTVSSTDSTKYIKEVTVDKTATSNSSGAISATVVNSDSKSGTANASSKSISFSKPWYIFEHASSTISGLGTLIENYIGGTTTGQLEKGTSGFTAIEKTYEISLKNNYIWYAVPNTLTKTVDATQLGVSIANKTAIGTVSTTLGTYTLFRNEDPCSAGTYSAVTTLK